MKTSVIEFQKNNTRLLKIGETLVVTLVQQTLEELEKKFRRDMLELRSQSATDAPSANALWNRGRQRTDALDQEVIARINDIESSRSSDFGPRGWNGPRGQKLLCDL